MYSKYVLKVWEILQKYGNVVMSNTEVTDIEKKIPVIDVE